MTLLDRFRTPDRHKHPDPAVRLAYVEEIPLDERSLIGSIAREDEDARVRKAAIGKLMDPAMLGAIAREDRDETLRAQAAAMLRDIALEAFEGITEDDSLEAVDALTDARTLAQVAKTAGREIVALRALSRITDSRMLGSVARHAASEAARLGAFQRVADDAQERLSIAMNSEYKDSALAAVELISDRTELEQISSRGKNKSALKRARGIIREAEEQAAREAVPPAEPVDSPAPVVAPVSGPSAEERAEAEAQRAQEQERARALEAEAKRREQDQLAERKQAEAAERARQRSERAHVRLRELAEIAAAAAGDPDLASARQRLNVARPEWADLSAGVEVDAELAARFTEAESRIAARESETREADTRARAEALTQLHRLLVRVEPLPAKTDLTLKAADRALRDVRTARTSVPPLPSKQDFDEVSRRLKAVQTALTTKVQELRDADEWQRWANVGIQEQLCAKMEALLTLDDAERAMREVRQLQEQWRQAADVPRAQANQLWNRFKTAHDEVWGRAQARFAAEAATRTENLAKKTALCEKAESLADSRNWIQTAEEIKRLQAEWKAIGPVSRGREKAIWDRFRSACDRFFTRRHDDLVARKTTWAENLAKKEALSVRAEALSTSTDWDAAAAELRRLQADWKTIGPVKKTRSDAIWQRFHEACNQFFVRYGQRHDIARAERVAAREAICTELEALASPDLSEPASDLLAQVRALRTRWQQEIAARGVDPDRARELDTRFAAALAATISRWPAAFSGSDLDTEANRKRLESLVHRIEELAASVSGAAGQAGEAALSPTVRLAAMLKEALAANTIGGKVDDGSRWRAALEEVRQAQASWSRVGLVPDAVRNSLSNRFQRACRRITDGAQQAGRAGEAGKAGRVGGAGRTGA
jgi:hypothetical protein